MEFQKMGGVLHLCIFILRLIIYLAYAFIIFDFFT